MANKKISELSVRTPSLTDLMLVGDPSTGYSYKATISSLSTLLEANIALDDLNDVTITSPTAGQVLSYNGTAWVNDTNGITGTGTTNYVPKFTSSSAIGNSTLQTDANGNFGINVTPSNWSIGGSKALEIRNQGSALYSQSVQDLYVTQNAYYDVGWKYNFNSGASVYLQTGGNHEWHVASPGSSGSSISFLQAMILTASGGLGLGTSSPSPYKLSVNGDVRISTIANATTDTDKFIVSDGGVIKYRTGSEVLSDIGGAAASSISGTTNYIPKFTSSSAIGNSLLYDNGTYIGLGTTNPQYLFHTVTSAASIAAFRNSGAANGQVLVGNTVGDLSLRILSSGDALIFSDVSKYLAFGTNGATERMRITSGGEVGIGVTNPGSYNAGGNQLVIGGGAFRGLTIAGTTEGNIYFADGTTGTETYRGSVGYNHTSDYLFFYSAANERMRITSGGNVGIGLTNPAQRFVVRGQNGNSALEFDNKASNTEIVSYDRVASAYRDLYLHTSSASPTMVLNTSGNVGVGIVPTAYLGFVSSAAGISLHTSSTSGAAGLNFYENGSGRFSLRTLNGTAGLSFFDSFNGAERARIDASGNLGLGTSSPQTQLDIANGLMFGTIDAFPSATYDAAAVIAKTGSLGSAPFNNAGSIVYRARVTSTAGRSSHIFYTGSPSTERMRLDESGNLGLGTSSPIYKFMISDGTRTGVFNPNVSLDGFFIGTLEAKPLLFGTNDLERMRITSGGELLINTISDAGDYKLQVNGNVYSSSEIHSMGGTTGAQIRLSGSTNYGIIKDVNSVNRIWFENTGSYRTILDLPASGTKFDFRNSAGTSLLQVFSGGSIQTAAPSGGTAKPWKLGTVATVSPTSPNRTIEVDVDGTTYYLHAKTTND